MKKMNILISTDKKYLNPYLVMLTSLFYNNKEYDFDIYLMIDNVDSQIVDSVEKQCSAFSTDSRTCTVYIIPVIENNNFGNYINSHVSRQAYFRLFAAKYLPDNLDRVLWLDGDITINGQITDLYSQKMDSETIFYGAENELSNIEQKFYSRVPAAKGCIYINSGVLLINLAIMRKIVDIKDVENFVVDNKDILQYDDQDIINFKYYDKIKYVEKHKYNFMPSANLSRKNYTNGELKKQIATSCIIHHAGTMSAKPFRLKYAWRISMLNFYKKYTKMSIKKSYFNWVYFMNVCFLPLFRLVWLLKIAYKKFWILYNNIFHRGYIRDE